MSTAPRNKDRDRDRDRELSEILQEAQLLRAEVLQRAQSDAKKLAEPLWRVLLREGLLTDDQLFRVLKQYIRVPVLAEEHLENVVVPPELREALKPRLAQLLGVLPLERSTDGKRAALAMIDPTLDIAPLWPALTQLGVVEVRRFLLNLPTLRRGMLMFYNQSFEAESANADLDGPTPPPSRSAITQPIVQPISAGPSVLVDPGLQAEIEQLSGQMEVPELSGDVTGPIDAVAPAGPSRQSLPSSLLMTMPSARSTPGAEPASRRSANPPPSKSQQTPLHRVSSGPGAAPSSAIPIEIDLPDLLLTPAAASRVTPLHELSGLRSPLGSIRSGPAAAQPPALAGPPSRPPVLGRPTAGPGSSPALPSAASTPPPTPAASPSGAASQSGVAPLAALLAARPAVPTPLPSSSQSPVQELSAADMVLDEERGGLAADRRALRVPAAQSESKPEVAQDAVQEALLSTCEALVAAIESHLRTSWPTTLSRLCQGVGDQLGFAPRAVRELMLVARLRGVVRAELLAHGPLPPPRPTLLGYPTSSPLLAAARELQKVLVDFMRLPHDDDEPLGLRIVATAAQALELRDSGLSDDELIARLRAQGGDSNVVFQVHKALALALDPPELAPSAAPPSNRSTAAPAAPPPTRFPALWPRPPRMPTVGWTTRRVAQLSDEGLLPYQPDAG